MYYADLQFMCVLVTKIALEKAVFGVCVCQGLESLCC